MAAYFFQTDTAAHWGFFLGSCFIFVFAPAFKDENVVSDACQQAKEIHERSRVHLAPRWGIKRIKRLSLAEEKGRGAALGLRGARRHCQLWVRLQQALRGTLGRTDRQRVSHGSLEPLLPKSKRREGGGGVGVKAAAACLGARLLYGDLSGKQTREKWIK